MVSSASPSPTNPSIGKEKAATPPGCRFFRVHPSLHRTPSPFRPRSVCTRASLRTPSPFRPRSVCTRTFHRTPSPFRPRSVCTRGALCTPEALFSYICGNDIVSDRQPHAVRGTLFHSGQRLQGRGPGCAGGSHGAKPEAPCVAGERRPGRPWLHGLREKRDERLHPCFRHRHGKNCDARQAECRQGPGTGALGGLDNPLRRARAHAEPLHPRNRPERADEKL